MFEPTNGMARLFECDNELDRFDFLALSALTAPKYPTDKKTNDHRVRSCETNTWLYIDVEGSVFVESDSLFLKGLIVLFADAAHETHDGAEGFFEECFRRGIITAKRLDGLKETENIILKRSKKGR